MFSVIFASFRWSIQTMKPNTTFLLDMSSTNSRSVNTCDRDDETISLDGRDMVDVCNADSSPDIHVTSDVVTDTDKRVH